MRHPAALPAAGHLAIARIEPFIGGTSRQYHFRPDHRRDRPNAGRRGGSARFVVVAVLISGHRGRGREHELQGFVRRGPGNGQSPGALIGFERGSAGGIENAVRLAGRQETFGGQILFDSEAKRGLVIHAQRHGAIGPDDPDAVLQTPIAGHGIAIGAHVLGQAHREAERYRFARRKFRRGEAAGDAGTDFNAAPTGRIRNQTGIGASRRIVLNQEYALIRARTVVGDRDRVGAVASRHAARRGGLGNAEFGTFGPYSRARSRALDLDQTDIGVIGRIGVAFFTLGTYHPETVFDGIAGEIAWDGKDDRNGLFGGLYQA